jgi:putative membrane protein
MKETQPKVGADQAMERTPTAVGRALIGWIRAALTGRGKEITQLNATPPKTGDVLAYERTRMAAERTLMGWIRTALSMIGFGFTIYKFLESVENTAFGAIGSKRSPESVGLTLIGIGVFALTIACTQHWKYVKNLRPDQPYKPWDLSFVVAFLIGGFGIVIFISIVLKSGPLG